MTCLKHEASGGRHSRVNGRDSSTTFPFPPVLAPLRLSSASSRLCPPPFPSSSPSSASFLPSRRRGGEKVQAAALLPMPTSSTLAAAVVTSAGGGGRAPRPCCQGFGPPRRDWWRRNARPAGYKRQGLRCKRAKARARAAARADWVSRGRCWVELGASLQPQLCDGHYSSLLSSRRHCRLYRGTGGMIRPQSLMRKLSPSCGVLGHAFMEFLKGPGEYRQAQHDLYEDKWTVEIRCYSTKKPP